MLKLKICGLQPGDDLSFTSCPEISHVGFIFVPASRRFVRPEAVSEMSKQVDRSCRTVGVFVNAPLTDLLDTAQVAGIDVIQLHGHETPDYCRAVKDSGFEVWKALSVKSDDGDTPRLASQVEQLGLVVDAVLLDAAPPKGASTTVTGGHGNSFDWSKLGQLQEELNQRKRLPRNLPMWIAGGITPENTEHLLRQFIPYGLDVSSGVEVDKRKSLNRIEAMRKAVSRYEDSAAAR